MSDDAVVQAVALVLTEHRPRRAGAVTCTCGYVAGGFDDLTTHQSRAAVAAARPFIETARDDPQPPEPVECCASGRCEVCCPGFDWGRDG